MLADLTAGEYPSSDPSSVKSEGDFSLTARRAQKTSFQDENGHFLRDWKPDYRFGNETDNGYKAQLVKVWSACKQAAVPLS